MATINNKKLNFNIFCEKSIGSTFDSQNLPLKPQLSWLPDLETEMCIKKFCIIYFNVRAACKFIIFIRQKWTFIAIKDIKLSEQLYSQIF